ncbi:MAG: single-stranded DNA-binding protein [Sporomusaceae bacterium]|nr:single-stranded DNA-binding protein [Sporomusaceae bacterium]
MNQVVLVGRLARDPEVRYTKTGKAVATFTVAVSRNMPMAQRDLNEKEPADFIPVVAWDKLAEMCGNNLAKGSRVFVQGRLQVRSYETQDGQRRWVTEVVADLVAQNFESDGPRAGAAPVSRTNDAAKAFGGREVFPPEEEIPF